MAKFANAGYPPYERRRSPIVHQPSAKREHQAFCSVILDITIAQF
jgi:hypothetical protein